MRFRSKYRRFRKYVDGELIEFTDGRYETDDEKIVKAFLTSPFFGATYFPDEAVPYELAKECKVLDRCGPMKCVCGFVTHNKQSMWNHIGKCEKMQEKKAETKKEE